MVGSSSIARGKRYRYYECNNRLRTKGCPNKRVPKEALEEHVKNELLKTIFNPKNVATLIKHLNNYRKETAAKVNTELKDVKRQQAKTEKETNNIVAVLAVKGISALDSLKDKLESLEEEKKRLDARVVELEYQAPLGQIEERHVREFVNTNIEHLKQNDLLAIKETVQQYVESVVVETGKVLIHIKLDLDIDGAVGAYHATSETLREKIK